MLFHNTYPISLFQAFRCATYSNWGFLSSLPLQFCLSCNYIWIAIFFYKNFQIHQISCGYNLLWIAIVFYILLSLSSSWEFVYLPLLKLVNTPKACYCVMFISLFFENSFVVSWTTNSRRSCRRKLNLSLNICVNDDLVANNRYPFKIAQVENNFLNRNIS